MNRFPVLQISWLFFGLSILGCDTAERQADFFAEANRPPSGIVETDVDGKIIREDLDDWRTAPAFEQDLFVDPAYPNPVLITADVVIPLTVNRSLRSGVWVRYRSSDGTLRVLDTLEEARSPGLYFVNFNASQLGSDGLHRVYFFDGFGELISYGDIEVRRR